MRHYNYDEPFEDEELEKQAWEHFERAREEGSLLSDEQLIRECRKLAHEDFIRLKEFEAEPIPQPEEE
ncbi:MAG TPA: hypothetical protein VNK96_07080 [Fimbriimonadales bacterium]|nr:hypothetical protein [Fimbriimonadales bacterium]